MTKILVLNTGLNGEQSNSNKFTSLYQKIRNTTTENQEYTVRDLDKDALPHLTSQEMQAWMTPESDRTEQQQTLAAVSDELIDELMAHDVIVIGMPMYNMGVPSTFKTYIDRVSRAGKTFRYTEQGPEGLVKGKQVVVLAARGGMYQGTPLDSQTSYLQSIFGLMGVTDIQFVYAEGLNMGEDAANNAWQSADQSLHSLVS